MWSGLGEQADDLNAELASLRFKTQEGLAERQFGSLHGLRLIEIGAGRATNALYALRGAEATVLDASTVALEQSVQRFEARGLEVRTIHSDVFEIPSDVRESFDISMSFGLCEHFSGERPRRAIAAHAELPKPGGIAMVNVPNRLSPFYRLRMDLSKRRGTWSLGYEVPFPSRELDLLMPIIGSGGTSTGHNQSGRPE
jgi:cyclopropane fatty-acyl-phospholipid synthase-like methyltransferase